MMTLQPSTAELEFDEELESESEIPDAHPGQGQLFAATSDPTIEVLHNRHKRGDLMLDPEFQRHFIWDDGRSGRLLESVILDVPLPVIYLAEEQDGKEAVIDGQQRLTAFFRFLDGTTALSGLKVRRDLNGRKFSALEKALQNKILNFSIRTITIRKESDPGLKFEIFERLNTGSMALNDQELRNCVYRGRYNDLLKSMGTTTVNRDHAATS